MERLFGSKTRARILGLLADSAEPKTGYEISRVLGANPSKVYDTLRKLESTGLLGVVRDRPRRKRYYLADEALRRLLLKYVRIAAEEDWFSPLKMREREEASRLAERLKVGVPRVTEVPERLRNLPEFARLPEKDWALRRIAKLSKKSRRERKG